MRKVKIKGIWKYIFSDKEKNQIYKEQKQNLSKAEKKLLEDISKKKEDKNG